MEPAIVVSLTTHTRCSLVVPLKHTHTHTPTHTHRCYLVALLQNVVSFIWLFYVFIELCMWRAVSIEDVYVFIFMYSFEYTCCSIVVSLKNRCCRTQGVLLLCTQGVLLLCTQGVLLLCTQGVLLLFHRCFIENRCCRTQGVLLCNNTPRTGVRLLFQLNCCFKQTIL